MRPPAAAYALRLAALQPHLGAIERVAAVLERRVRALDPLRLARDDGLTRTAHRVSGLEASQKRTWILAAEALAEKVGNDQNVEAGAEGAKGLGKEAFEVGDGRAGHRCE